MRVPSNGFRSYINPIQFYHNSRIKSFRPKLRFSFTTGNFTVKTAQSSDELREILKLRHQIFIEEGLGSSRFMQLDFDKFDLVADHILLIDNAEDKVIGTYRILSSDLVKTFYSATEFVMDRFLREALGLKLELGRACIDKDYRKGSAIHLIWKGLGRYACLTSADYFFGCTSIKTQSYSQMQDMMEALGDAYSAKGYGIKPRFKFRFYPERLGLELYQDPHELVPVLLSSYIKAGAKVYGEPAYDRDFKCFDLFTCLNFKELPDKYMKKYLGAPR